MFDLKIYLENYFEAQDDELEFVKYDEHFEENPCNIYIIGGRPRVIINPDYLNYDLDFIELEFKIQDKFDFKAIRGKLPIIRKIEGELKIESEFPYSRFNLIDDAGYHFHSEEYQSKKDLKLKASYALRKSFSNFDRNLIDDFEVLYIGQSIKMNKKLSPVKRLKSHSKFQKVLSKCNSTYIDKEIYIILCSFVAKIGMSATDKELRKIDDLQKFFINSQATSREIKNNNQLVTNIAEAALIDYFNTNEFNVDFIGSFGNKSHKYSKFLADSIIDKLSVEIDLNKLCRIYPKTIEENKHHGIIYDIKNNYEREIFNAELTK